MLQLNGSISGKVTRERRAAARSGRGHSEKKKEEVEVEKDCEEGIEESEAGNETVLGQSWGERERRFLPLSTFSLSL